MVFEKFVRLEDSVSGHGYADVSVPAERHVRRPRSLRSVMQGKNGLFVCGGDCLHESRCPFWGLEAQVSIQEFMR